MIRDVIRAGMLAFAFAVVTTDFAVAATQFDGQWTLTFSTRRGDCEPTYNFDIYITNGVLEHPNLVRFKGRVNRNGDVQASVAVEDKFASGSGRLTGNSGRGNWSGYEGSVRCSGIWTARRF